MPRWGTRPPAPFRPGTGPRKPVAWVGCSRQPSQRRFPLPPLSPYLSTFPANTTLSPIHGLARSPPSRRAGPVAALPDGIAVADVVEKDWSFLDAAAAAAGGSLPCAPPQIPLSPPPHAPYLNPPRPPSRAATSLGFSFPAKKEERKKNL
ncbi:hypothetical protein DAI22_08g123150 [Oryza sativa Japonica Group]|nr:hypothetical protein DAI22_08g123150 [Oryza sativa Japonica Group]